jgi:dienelactone hydrolase
MRNLFLLAALLFGSSLAHATVQGKEVIYTSGDTTLKGYIAYDDAIRGKRPGILVVHEWWGNNGYARERATMLAKLGYTALALDMYGEGKEAIRTRPQNSRMSWQRIYPWQKRVLNRQ